MTKTLQQRRESSIVTLDDAVRLIWRASKSRNEILGEAGDDHNQYVVPSTDSDIFRAFQENLRFDMGQLADLVGIAAALRLEGNRIPASVDKLLKALYSPSGTVSEARQEFPLIEDSYARKIRDLKDGNLFWQCIDYLRKINHPARFDTLINGHAKTNTKTFEGVKVRESFYTAAYCDGWNYGEPSRSIDVPGHLFVNTSPNHAETYLVGGYGLGVGEPFILIRTGNGIAGIRPSARAVDKTGKVGEYVAYQTRGLPLEAADRIISRLGLDEKYKRIGEMAKALGRR